MSLNIQQNVSIKSYNTLAVDVSAQYFTELLDESKLPDLLSFADTNKLPVTVLGGGSNIVLTQDLPGLVIKMASKGIQIDLHNNHYSVTVKAGENWHELVMTLLAQGIAGLENLALIPGTAGAAAVQNIGAYGVELDSVFESLVGWDFEAGQLISLNRQACEFAYRDSIFKHALKDRFIITELVLRLPKSSEVNYQYKDLADYLVDVSSPSPSQVAEAVIAIRRTKLPDPGILPNAGSFFKNPIVDQAALTQIKQRYPNIVSYALPNGRYKLAAGWLIDQLGWKGRIINSVAMHEKQALVLTNQGGTGADIIRYAKAIQDDVFANFGVTLEVEPRVY